MVLVLVWKHGIPSEPFSDGKEFHGEKMRDIQSKILLFWTSFREGCPDFRVETRGTNSLCWN